jgi:hypothetical protein
MQDRRDQSPFSAELPRSPFADHSDHRHFAALVRDYFVRRGQRLKFRDDLSAIDELGMSHGFYNLAQVCQQAPRSRWPGLVRDHLDRSDPRLMQGVAESMTASRYTEVRDNLLLRIYPEDYLAQCPSATIVHRTDLPGTITVLVLDSPSSAMAVPTPIAQFWGVSTTELFARALANVALRSYPWKRLELPPPCDPFDYATGDLYVTSQALCPGRLPVQGRHGNLLGLPHRGILLCYPIDRLPSLAPLEALLPMTHGMFRDGPGSITPHLYWHTPEGRFLRLQGSCEGERVRVAPCPEFTALWERLRRADGEEGL